MKNLVKSITFQILRRPIIRKLKKKLPTSDVDISCKYDEKTYLQGNNSIQNNVDIRGTKIGKCTYIGHDSSLLKCEIGKFCSISWNVEVIAGRHPAHMVSTHPLFYRDASFSGLRFCDYSLFDEYRYTNNDCFVCIGNDVLIGAHAKILDGVTIGDGAIILSGAMVTRDVLPYKIVGGIPAREMGQRFTDDEIDWLEKIRWWNMSEEWIKTNAPYFNSISKLKEKITI